MSLSFKKITGLVMLIALLLAGILVGVRAVSADNGFADPLFQAKWQTLDGPVAQGKASYSWVYGPTALTIKTEPYAEAPNGQRLVQYFDKARMELTKRAANPNAVTAGLLTVELVSGKQQTGDTVFVPGSPASIPVAGDGDDPAGPSYASFTGVATVPGTPHPIAQNTAAITDTINRDGVTSTFAGALPTTATNAYYIKETGHNIPDIFINWLTKKAPGNWIDVMGYPITDAYWATVKVGGVQKTVLMQLFERRVLTFTASNSPQYQIEYGNIGQHYYYWRYGNTAQPAPTQTPLPVPFNGNGIWRGQTSQGKPVFFTVDNNAVTTILYGYTMNGCQFDFHSDDIKQAIPLANKAFTYTSNGKLSHVVTGILSNTQASGSLAISPGTEPSCTGTLNLTWTATKDPPANTTYDGQWNGTTSGKKSITFGVANHALRTLDMPYTVSSCSEPRFTVDFMDYYNFPSVSANNTFLVKDIETSSDNLVTVSFTFTGTFTSPTKASGNYQISIKVAQGYTLPCAGQVAGTFTATKQVSAMAFAAAPGDTVQANRTDAHDDNR